LNFGVYKKFSDDKTKRDEYDKYIVDRHKIK